MKSLHAILIALCLTLGACGSVPPAPTDHFYRLQPVSVPPVAQRGSSIEVQDFRADSLYAERPIIYSEADNLRQLRQYHYHLWLYAPAQMVQTHLASSLGSALDLSGGRTAARTLNGRVVNFERVVSGKNSKAVAALELRLRAGDRLLLNKTYQAEQSASDDSLPAFAQAMEQALAAIYAEFLTDLAQSK